MIKKLRVGELKEGMVTAKDVHIPTPLLKEGKIIGVKADDDESLTLIPAGIVISKKIIELFKNHVEYVDVLVRSILVSLDETTITEEVTKNVKVNGKLRISANISPFIKISATNKVIIESNIPAGCTIESETADIVIKGDISGTKQAPVRLKAFNGISANSIAFSELVAGGSAVILKNVIDSLIISKEMIT
ncbi:MAG: hypothetical protein HQK93_08225 [Nitrospirae bacterium]|nr:hypothetical protein [Nitrospirota bacterium]